MSSSAFTNLTFRARALVAREPLPIDGQDGFHTRVDVEVVEAADFPNDTE